MENIRIFQVKHGDPLHSESLNLRHEVLRVPIGRSLFAEDLSQEVNDTFFVAVVNSLTSTMELGNGISSQSDSESTSSQKVIGHLLVTAYIGGDTGFDTNRIRQMAVSSDYQGKGVGRMLVQEAETFSKKIGKNRMYLHGRKVASEFYLKMGYQIISEEFLESGIPHYAMEKLFV